jgi:type II secretion system protein H
VVPARREPTPPVAPRAAERGFTLMELLVVLTVMALGFAIVVPNLGAFVPEAKLDSAAKQIVRTLDWVRSEARIQAKRISVDFDLSRHLWRIVYPPEQQLTRDQDTWTLEEMPDDWNALERGVVFGGAGDARSGLATRDVYRLTFDEHGFTADQMLVLRLEEDPTMVWSLVLHGISGRMDVERDQEGHTHKLDVVEEGAF